MRSAELEAVLEAHAYLQVERPPVIWATDVTLEPFLRLLGEMIAAGLVRNGGVLSGITLNVSNVTVEPSAGSTIPSGDFVAITIRGKGDWRPETTWRAKERDQATLVSADLAAAANRAGATYGYTRSLADDHGSVTVFLSRAVT